MLDGHTFSVEIAFLKVFELLLKQCEFIETRASSLGRGHFVNVGVALDHESRGSRVEYGVVDTVGCLKLGVIGCQRLDKAILVRYVYFCFEMIEHDWPHWV